MDFRPEEGTVWHASFRGVGPDGRTKLSPLDHLVWRAKRQWRNWFP
jgi:hypothetical protein